MTAFGTSAVLLAAALTAFPAPVWAQEERPSDMPVGTSTLDSSKHGSIEGQVLSKDGLPL